MIKLDSDTFRRAIEKASTTRPACTLSFTDDNNYTFTVARADGRPATVDIWFQGGTLWTSCDCAAGMGLHRRGNPQPCYHVAAAALSVGLFAQVMPLGAHLDPTPECKAARVQVPAPLVDVSELAPLPASIPASAPTPQIAAWHSCLSRAARLLGRVFWFARESRA